MSEDRFFQQVKSVMTDYQPEVPANVYEGMRKKMWWSNFTKLSISRFNVWYLAVALGVVAGIMLNSETGTIENTGSLPTQVVQPAPVISPAPAVSEVQPPVVVDKSESSQAGKLNKPQAQETAAAVMSNNEVNAADVAVAPSAPVSEESKVMDVKTEQEPAQNAVKSGRRGLKVKTYTSEGEKK